MKDKQQPLGPMELPNGTYTKNMEESLEHLLELHFPLDANMQRSENDHSKINDEVVSNIITEEKLRMAISSFAPYKAAGMDGIIPAMLQQGRKN